MSELDYEFHNPNRETLADLAITPGDKDLPKPQWDCIHDKAWCYCEFDNHIFIQQNVR